MSGAARPWSSTGMADIIAPVQIRHAPIEGDPAHHGTRTLSKLDPRWDLDRRSRSRRRRTLDLRVRSASPARAHNASAEMLAFMERGETMRDFGLRDERCFLSLGKHAFNVAPGRTSALGKVGSPSASDVIGAEESAVRVPESSAPRPAATQRAGSSSRSAEMCLGPSGRSGRTSPSLVQTKRRRRPCPTIARTDPRLGEEIVTRG